MQKQEDDDAKNGELSSAQKKRLQYSKKGLFQEDILNHLNYKAVYAALSSDDSEALGKLVSPFTRVSLEIAYRRFENMAKKRDK